MSEENKGKSSLVSFNGGKKKEEAPLLEYVKITYTDGDSEIIQSGSWGMAEQLDNFLVFFKVIDKDTDVLSHFRNLSLIKKLDFVDKEGNNV
jgi:hypothetical protein